MYVPFCACILRSVADKPREPGNSFEVIVYKWTIPVVLTFMIGGAAVVMWHMSRLSENLVNSATIDGTALYSNALAELRILYTAEVVDRVLSHGIEVTHDYKDTPSAIPLPATFSMELGRRIGEHGTGMRVKLYSDYPFPSRKDRPPMDSFEKEALVRLRAAPDSPFFRVESVDGRLFLRYATADRMRPACVSCQNTHPASPKKDWKNGDVRGVLQIMRPLDRARTQTAAGLRDTFILMGGRF